MTTSSRTAHVGIFQCCGNSTTHGNKKLVSDRAIGRWDLWEDEMCKGTKCIWLENCLETHLASSYCKSPPTIPSPTGTGPEILYTIVSRSSLRLILTPLVQREIQGWDWGSYAAKLHALLKQVGSTSITWPKTLVFYMPLVLQNGPIKRRADRG